MPPPIPVVLAPYDLNWPQMAEEHAERLQVLGSILLEVHHIGSTAVPGMLAKPIIDLLPVVANLDDLDCERQKLEVLGYAWHGELGMSGRRYCTLSNNAGVRTAQLHFFRDGSPEIERHLAFRDYLRTHPQVALAYAQEKLRARDMRPNDSHAYTDEKAVWIEDTLAKALAWFSDRQGADGKR